MKTAAVVIDKWKLAIFTRHLRGAAYTYDTVAGVTGETWTLKVPYTDLASLRIVIQAAENECARSKK